MKLYLYTVPDDYYCDGHEPGDTYTVRVTCPNYEPGWLLVENVETLDEFPAQHHELKEISE